MEQLVRLVTVAVVLILVQELFRRANPRVAWGVFLGLPLVLTPWWARMGDDGAYAGMGIFPWVKLYSLQIGACWLTALRFTSLRHSRWALGLIFLMLPFNILEAVTQDFFGDHRAHYLVGLAGVLLILSVPHPMRAIRVDTSGRYYELRYVGMTRTWIAGYTLWNGAFVYLNFPAVAGHQLAVLAAGFAVGMVEPSRWLQSRTYTLAIDLLAFATVPGVLVPFTDTSHWTSPYREDVAAGSCLVIVAVYAVGFFVRHGKRTVAVLRLAFRSAPLPKNTSDEKVVSGRNPPAN